MPTMKTAVLALWAVLPVFSSVGAAQLHGTFSADGPSGTFRTGPDRPEFTLSQQFYFDDPDAKRWVVPAGITVNGASIPQIFWSIIGGPFEGDYLNASVIHDYFFVTRTESSDATHRVFYLGMLSKNVPDWKAAAMYWAVSTFNEKWEPREVARQVTQCVGTTCTTSTQLVTENVVTQTIDLSDPEVAALAVSKFNAIVRTLKTTNGGVLDVSALGQVTATPESIESNANRVREVLASKAYRTDPELLGVLSTFKIESLDAAPRWENGELPNLSRTPAFDIDRTKPVIIDQGYKLDPENMIDLPSRLDLSPKTFNAPELRR